ncbi:MAG: TetR/AcrR family transcriptional regulator [Bacteroidota bacterium]
MDTNSLEIINSAADLFDRYGARKTTMEDIAREVGKGKSTLYYYFKNKEEVFESVLRHEFDSLKSQIMEAITEADDCYFMMKEFVKAVFSGIHQFRNLKKSLLNEVDGKSKATASLIRSQFIDWELSSINQILAKGMITGAFRNMTDQELVINSQAISIAMMGLKAILLNETDAEETNRKIDNLLSLLFNGISNQHGTK